MENQMPLFTGRYKKGHEGKKKSQLMVFRLQKTHLGLKKQDKKISGPG